MTNREFVLLQGFLIYAYFEDAPNNDAVREFVEKGNKFQSMKIGYRKPKYVEDVEEV